MTKLRPLPIGPRIAVAALLLGGVFSACSSAPASHPAEGPTEIAETARPADALSSGPVATAPSSPASSSPVSPATGKSCLMLHVCGCNLGCASIGLPSSKLHEGDRATMLTGPMAGKEGIVVIAPRKGGGDVLAISDRERSAACSVERPSPLLGFACAAKDSGAVDERACISGCGVSP